MKMYMIDVYKVFFKVTGETLSAVVLAVLYASLLNLVVIYYLSFLLQGLSDNVMFFIRNFYVPYLLVILVACMAYNLSLLMPFKKLSRRSKLPQRIAPIIAYSLAAILLVFYTTHYSGIF
jgi:hypothetical protein